MQKSFKYHKYLKIQLFLRIVPLRVLRFNRPKWKRLQKKILKNFFFQRKRTKKFKNKKVSWRKKKKIFLNNIKIKKFWKYYFDKYKKSYKNGLQLKNSWQIYTYNIFKNKKLKKKVINTKIVKNFDIFLKSLLRVDIFLCKLKISKNILESKMFILKGFIKINDIQISDPRIYLKQGDTVYIDPNLSKIKSCIIKRFEYPLEIDFYSNTLIFAKPLELTESLDIAFLKFDRLSYRKLYNFFKL